MTTDNTPLFGIDLGTTNSCIVVYDIATGKPLVVNNLDSLPTTPSVIYIPDNLHAVVGRDAVNRLGSAEAKKVIEYLSTVEGRFEFVFTPKHASWLNLVDTRWRIPWNGVPRLQ